MAKKAQLTASLPKLAVTPEMRERLEKIAEVAEVSLADVQRDALLLITPMLELDLGIVQTTDEEDEEAGESLPAREDRARGCAWGPPKEG